MRVKLEAVMLVLLGVVLIFSAGAMAQTESEESTELDLGNLNNLDFKIEGSLEDDPATFRFRGKRIGEEDESVRLDVTTEDGGEMIVILVKGEKKGWFKDLEETTWQVFPSMMFSQMWTSWREPYLSIASEESTSWEEMEGEEYEIETEKETVTVYDIEVNETVDESIFEPN